MTAAESEFRKWFIESLAKLRDDGDAGFVFALVAFPLLERHLRSKAGCPDGADLTPNFFSEVGLLFPDVAGKENDFWSCYRNGLLHQVTFPKAKRSRKRGAWIELPQAGISGYDKRPVYFNATSNRFYLNPQVFFDRVCRAILEDFSTYEGANSLYNPLPGVVCGSTGKETIVPTISCILPKTKSP